jgi:hypothetical protein
MTVWIDVVLVHDVQELLLAVAIGAAPERP